MEEIHVLPVSQFLLFMIPMLLKKHYVIEYLEPHQAIATGGGGEKDEAQHEERKMKHNMRTTYKCNIERKH